MSNSMILDKTKESNLLKVIKRKKIFSIGTYTKPNKDGKLQQVTFTLKDLEKIVKNYNELYSRFSLKPIIKINHEKKPNDGSELSLVPHLKMGEVSNLFIFEGSLFADLELFPEVYDLWESGRLNSVSVEIKPNFKVNTTNEVFNMVLSGVALLGADLPELWDVTGIREEYANNDESIFYEFNKFNFAIEEDIMANLPSGNPTTPTVEVETNQQQDQENKTDAMLAEMNKRLLALEDENKKLKQSVAVIANDNYLKGKAEGMACSSNDLKMSLETLQSDNLKLQTQLLKEKSIRENQEIDEFLFSLEKEKITLPAQRDNLKDFILKATTEETTINFSNNGESQSLSSREAFKNLLKNFPKKNLNFEDVLPDETNLNFSLTENERELIKLNPEHKEQIIFSAKARNYMTVNKLDPNNPEHISLANKSVRK